MHNNFDSTVPVPRRKNRDIAKDDQDITIDIVEQDAVVAEVLNTTPEIDSPKTATTYRKIGRFCLFMLIAILPIFFLSFGTAPVEQAKMILLIASVLISLVACLATIIREREARYPRSFLSFSVLLFLLVSIVSTIFSKNPHVSFYGNLAFSDSLLAIICYVAIFFLSFFFFSKEDFGKIGKLYLFGFFFATLINVLQLFGSFVFPWSITKQSSFNTIGSLAGWGVLLAGTFAMIIELPLRDFSSKKKFLLLLCGALTIFGLLLLNFQLLWVSIAFLMVIVSAFHFITHDRFGGSLALVVIALFLALISARLPAIRQIPAEIRPNFPASLSVARGVIGPRLLFGMGPGTFESEWALHRPMDINTTQFWSTRFHQGFGFFVTLLTTTGIAGICSFLLLVYAFLRSAMHLVDNRKALVIAVGAFSTVISIFLFPATTTNLFYLFFGLGFLAQFEGRERIMRIQDVSRKKAFVVFIACVICIALSLASLYVLSQKYVAAMYHGSALRVANAGNIPEAIQKLDTAIRLDKNSDEYFRSASQILFVRINQLMQQNAAQSSDANVRNEFQSTVSNTIIAARHATELNTGDPINWVNLAQIYEGLSPIVNGANTFAVATYRKAMELDPQNPQLPVDVARVLAATDMPGAFSMIDVAIRLKADYAPAHFLAAQLYIRDGKTKQAIEKLEAARQSSPFDAGLAFQIGLIYYQSNQLSSARGEFERAVGLNSQFPNAIYFLGLTYDRMGERALAIAQFQKLHDFVPDNTEVDRILNNLKAGRSALQNIAPPSTPPEKRDEVPVPEKKP